jgi:hypothetical protein
LNKQRPDELSIDARVIRFEKDGLKALTYQNDRGQLLSLFDTRVFLGLHKLWERNQRQKEFSFHDWELLDIINLGKSGKHYEMLEESLKTLYATSVVMQEFYDRGKKKQIITEQFHLIQSRGEKIPHFVKMEKFVLLSIEYNFPIIYKDLLRMAI